MSFAQLQKACKDCRPSSIRTYWANIRALARLAGQDGVPSKSSWLNAKLLAAVLAEPVGRSKRFLTAGVKAAQMYRIKKDKWLQAMSEVTEKYANQRKTGKRTAREAANWPEGGYKALSRLAKDLYSEVGFLANRQRWNTRDLYHYQRYLIVLFYSLHALRGDLADVRIKAPWSTNWLRKTGSSYTLQIGRHKTSRAHGAIDIKIGGELNRGSAGPQAQLRKALDVFLPHVRSLTNHGFLLSTLRGANKLKRQDMLRLIRNVTKDRLGKNIGVQIIRVLKVSDSAAEIDKAVALQKELGHSALMQQKYISR